MHIVLVVTQTSHFALDAHIFANKISQPLFNCMSARAHAHRVVQQVAIILQ